MASLTVEQNFVLREGVRRGHRRALFRCSAIRHSLNRPNGYHGRPNRRGADQSRRRRDAVRPPSSTGRVTFAGDMPVLRRSKVSGTALAGAGHVSTACLRRDVRDRLETIRRRLQPSGWRCRRCPGGSIKHLEALSGAISPAGASSDVSRGCARGSRCPGLTTSCRFRDGHAARRRCSAHIWRDGALALGTHGPSVRLRTASSARSSAAAATSPGVRR